MKKIFAVLVLISTFSSMVLSVAIFNRQNAFEAKLEMLSNKQDSFENNIEVLSKKVDEIASDVKVLSVRMDGLEKRVEKLEEKNESRLDLMLSALAAGVAWLTLVATVLALKKSGSEARQPLVTLADMQRLIDENNAKLNLTQKG